MFTLADIIGLRRLVLSAGLESAARQTKPNRRFFVFEFIDFVALLSLDVDASSCKPPAKPSNNLQQCNRSGGDTRAQQEALVNGRLAESSVCLS